MLPSFRQWLEYQTAGMVDAAQMNNVAADDQFKKIRSKWMSGNIPQRGSEFDAEGLFGKEKKHMKADDNSKRTKKKRRPKSK